MKRSLRLIAALTTLALAVTATGCQLVEVNPEKDVAATVNGESISMKELNDLSDYYIQFYSMMGMDVSDQAQLNQMKLELLESMIQQKVVMQKAAELGLNKFTPEEQAEVDENYQTQLDSYLESYRAKAEEEASGTDINVDERMKQLLEADLTSQGVTYEELKQNIVDSKVYEKALAYVKDPVAVTDEDAKAAYDEELASQKTKLESDATAYESLANYGTTALVIPDGYIRVKHILIGSKPSEDDQKVIDEKEAKQKELSDQMSELILDDADKNADQINSLKDQINALKDEVAALNEKAAVPAKAKIDDLYSQLQGGADFEKLLADNGEDPGMESNADGYLVSAATTAYVEPFKNAAMALKADGDFSAPVESDFGYHIIKRVSTVQPKEVPFDEVKDEFLDKAKTSKQEETWKTTVADWEAAAKIVKHESKITG